MSPLSSLLLHVPTSLSRGAAAFTLAVGCLLQLLLMVLP
jgi:hypothetical protein